jgi:hypothetical protein
MEQTRTHLTRALARRERHRQRHLVVRALTLLAVGALIAGSVEVVLRWGFSPPLLVPACVGLLALEFHWAARLLAWGLERLTRFGRKLRRIARA